ncbi:hypothetical protein L2E82_47601 [Cichorium intybus]|uniref:Uncharacterized protein n=1 Tax=Cichorium intybus TaxID=13427 RepID=A0ACB8YWH6_CICIN|nr:hypothetical protein L2E82_47601 [Cichorium intybus]
MESTNLECFLDCTTRSQFLKCVRAESMKANPTKMPEIGREEAALAAGDGVGNIATSCVETDEASAAMKGGDSATTMSG